MDAHRNLPPVEWVKRVNGSWLVRGGLDQAAEQWLGHLRAGDPPRLEAACAAARAMCDIRDPLADPKPWFYAGLFSLATEEEAERFVGGHHVTLACVPAMWRNPQVATWLDQVRPGTRELVQGLRRGIERLKLVNRDD